MPKVKKPVIFIDLDGTILDVSERIYQVYKDILRKKERKYLSKDIYLKLKKDNLPIKGILERTKAEDIFSYFRKEWKKEIEKTCYLSLDKLSETEKKILLQLKKEHRLVLVTLRNYPKRLIKQLKEKKINNLFDIILTKPSENSGSRRKFKYDLIKKYGVYDKNSIIIGDTETDILTGKKLGIKTVAITKGMRNRNFLKKYKPDFLIKKLSEIKKCNF